MSFCGTIRTTYLIDGFVVSKTVWNDTPYHHIIYIGIAKDTMLLYKSQLWWFFSLIHSARSVAFSFLTAFFRSKSHIVLFANGICIRNNININNQRKNHFLHTNTCIFHNTLYIYFVRKHRIAEQRKQKNTCRHKTKSLYQYVIWNRKLGLKQI